MLINLNRLTQFIQEINDISNEKEVGHKNVLLRVNRKNNTLIAQLQTFYDMKIDIDISSYNINLQKTIKEKIDDFVCMIKQNSLVEDIYVGSNFKYTLKLKNEFVLNSQNLIQISNMKNHNDVSDYIIKESSTKEILNNLDILYSSFIDYFNSLVDAINTITCNNTLEKAI